MALPVCDLLRLLSFLPGISENKYWVIEKMIISIGFLSEKMGCISVFASVTYWVRYLSLMKPISLKKINIDIVFYLTKWGDYLSLHLPNEGCNILLPFVEEVVALGSSCVWPFLFPCVWPFLEHTRRHN